MLYMKPDIDCRLPCTEETTNLLDLQFKKIQ